MSAALILTFVGLYFLGLLVIAACTSRRADSRAYFLANRDSPWWLIAFGLIGDSLSGVTFISVPGEVGTRQFAYLQVVLGYVLGYLVIAHVLLPLYYRHGLTSIYTYLGRRLGPAAQKTGAFYFVLSRTLGAAARLYLAVSVFQTFVFNQWRIPFWLTTSVVIAMMLIYTYRGGIKTLVWTDLLQSSLLLLGLVLSIVTLMRGLKLDLPGAVRLVTDGPVSQVFFWDWRAPNYFWKQFLSGAFIAIVMTGLDQNMMQKNLSCRSLSEAQKNIHAFIPVLVVVNLLFLSLGALLHEFARVQGIAVPARTDLLFPTLALEHLGWFASIVFILGLTAATFNSADSVLTTLTTSFCIDFLRVEERPDVDEARRTTLRHRTHLSFAIILLAVILGFRAASRESVIQLVLKIAGYTYGPLLGLFAVSLVGRQSLRGAWVPVVCGASPLICYVLDQTSEKWLHGYRFGFELLMLNGALTALGLWWVRDRSRGRASPAT
ncbi:MAG TPA: sodium:solute symporter [Methylomirabilota bacterium]|nr:sodium:solute symporter [Methylomirabilota bacterium]